MRSFPDFLMLHARRGNATGNGASPRARRFGALFGLLVMVATMAATLAPASFAFAGTDAPQAKKLIEDLTKQALAVLKTEKGNLAQREAKFRTILTNYFAMQSISRTVAGKHWQDMSPKQQAEFQKLFSEWVLKTYSRRFGGYEGEDIAVGDASAVGRDSILVQTKVTGPSRDNKVEWRVRQEGREQNKIVDVSVDGVSMLVTQKSEIASIVKNKGVDGMLDTLRSHVQKANATR
ncbi:MAG: MlaC/ttg2D family ABC transporter substrate-binding protein [Alphaproteobacteria bacterium]